jgi:hypothetical protein
VHLVLYKCRLLDSTAFAAEADEADDYGDSDNDGHDGDEDGANAGDHQPIMTNYAPSAPEVFGAVRALIHTN